MLREGSDRVVSGVGDVFTMKMHNDETFDCSGAPEWLRNAVKGGARWIDSMTVTLERLDALSLD